jgi:hypothetical protein
MVNKLFNFCIQFSLDHFYFVHIIKHAAVVSVQHSINPQCQSAKQIVTKVVPALKLLLNTQEKYNVKFTMMQIS